jgi:hypothetical protein
VLERLLPKQHDRKEKPVFCLDRAADCEIRWPTS